MAKTLKPKDFSFCYHCTHCQSNNKEWYCDKSGTPDYSISPDDPPCDDFETYNFSDYEDN